MCAKQVKKQYQHKKRQQRYQNAVQRAQKAKNSAPQGFRTGKGSKGLKGVKNDQRSEEFAQNIQDYHQTEKDNLQKDADQRSVLPKNLAQNESKAEIIAQNGADPKIVADDRDKTEDNCEDRAGYELKNQVDFQARIETKDNLENQPARQLETVAKAEPDEVRTEDNLEEDSLAGLSQIITMKSDQIAKVPLDQTTAARSGQTAAIKPDYTDIEIEIDQPKQRHHAKWPWILGIILILVAVGGIITINLNNHQPSQDATQEQQPTDETQSDQSTENGENPSENPESPSENPENPSPEGPEVDPPAKEEPPVKAETPQLDPPISTRPSQNTEAPAVAPGSKVIALTFDDGPSTATTPRLLDILQGRDVHATFFVLGNLALRSPDLVRREEAEGHEVASHTPYHNQLTRLVFSQIRAEAIEMDRIFNEILGHVPPFTRPPYGSYNVTVGEALGQPMILWSIDPRDWADRNASIVCSRVTSAAFDGAIILVHDIHASTVDAVPCIIDNLRAQGYKFLTVSELAAYRGVPLVNGVAYGSF